MSYHANYVTACPFCQTSNFEHVLTRPEQYIDEGLCLYRCQHCNLVFLNPRLGTEAIKDLEDASEVYQFDADTIEQEISLRNNMLAPLEQLSQRRGGRLLDIGCNRGLMMEAARRRGWQPVGIELSPHAAQQARNDFALEVYESFDPLWSQEQFDLVIAWHVLEHTLDPRAFLRQAAGMLKEDGRFAIQVPSFTFLDEFEQRGRIGSLLCCVHTFYFTPESLTMLLNSVQLDVLWIDDSADSLMLTAVCQRRMQSVNNVIEQPELITEAQLSNLHNYIQSLEVTIKQKNNHIDELKDRIDSLQNGRIMRLLHRFTR